MARTTVSDTGVDIVFGPWERRGGFLKDQHIAWSSITEVGAVDDLAEIRIGWRAPGYGGWRRRIGWYRRRGVVRLVCAERGRPAWHASVTGHRFHEVVVGDDDAASIAASIATQLS